MAILSFDVDGIAIDAEIDAPDLYPILTRIGLEWRSCGASNNDVSIRIGKPADGGEGYAIDGPAFLQPFTCPWPADAASALIAGLVNSYGQRHPQNFCFHGAAIEIQGSTFLIPAVYRAGKSGLAMALRKLGCTVLSDDAVIYLPDTNELKSFGMPVRLRADFLNVCSDDLRAFIDARILHAGKRYVFVDAQTHGHTRKLSGFLFLKRNGTSPAALSLIDSDKALVQVICHNLARSALPGSILARFASLIESTPCLLLEYDSTESAAQFLTSQPLDGLANKPSDQILVGNDLQTDDSLTIREGPEDTIVADDRTGRIYHLNNSAYVMWKVARHSRDLGEAMEFLTVLYPDRSSEELSRDFLRVVERLNASELLDWSPDGGMLAQ